MIWRIAILIIILGGLGFILGKTIDFKQLLTLLNNFPKPQFLLLCVISLLISGLKSARFFLLLKNNGIDISFKKTVKVYLAGQLTTPLPGGEILRSFLLKKELGTGIRDTSAAVITQAFLEFMSASLMVVAGSLLLNVQRTPAIISVLFTLLIGVLLTHPKLLRKVSKSLDKIKKFKSLTTHLIEAQKDLRENILTKTFLYVLAIAIIANVLGGLIIYFIAQNYHPLGLIESIFLYCMSVVVSSLSGIIPAGLGFTEGGMIGLLFLYKVPLAESVAIVVIFRVITLLFYVLVGLVASSIFYGRSMIMNGLRKE